MLTEIRLEFLLIGLLCLTHLLADRIRLLDVIPRSGWLSFAGGTAVAYVFLHIIPELAAIQITTTWAWLAFVEGNAYLVALIGLVVFYGLERVVKRARRDDRPGAVEPLLETPTGFGLFWLHIGSFAIYNALIGYLLLHRPDASRASLWLYFVAMALHFVVNDYGLRTHHRGTYQRFGRYILTLALLAGFAVGLTMEVGEAVVGLLFALLAGGLILNVLKEELPEERQSRFWPFAAGAATYAALLLAI
ncbi:MAG: hypothetical protein ACNA7W_21020 [Pseudomonadales bacterium]